MSKQDRQGVRTAADLERKYNFRNLQKGDGHQDPRISQLIQSLTLLETSVKIIQKAVTDIRSKVETLEDETYTNTEIDAMLEEIKALIPGCSLIAVLDEAVLDEAVLA